MTRAKPANWFPIWTILCVLPGASPLRAEPGPDSDQIDVSRSDEPLDASHEQSNESDQMEVGAENQNHEEDDDFGELSIEELMQIEVVEVTSVAGVAKPLRATPSAVYVITAEDIRRSGHRNIAEALRMVPGLHVGRLGSNRWAITSRGFNSEYATKLLVLIDGRSIYSPLFSGVHWDIQNVVLEDIERIEVIRGPGATLWGANAVNGVINIITKHARDTQGLLLSGGAGTEERGFGTIRYGLDLAPNTFLRLYGLNNNRDGVVDIAGRDEHDDWDITNGGFRLDWANDDGYSIMFGGDFHRSDGVGENERQFSLFPPFAKVVNKDTARGGGDLLFRLSHDASPDSGWSLQAYYEVWRRSGIVLDEVYNTVDVDFRHRLRLSDRHQVLWGLGYRQTTDDMDNTFTLSLRPDSRSVNTYSGFIQDTIELVTDRWSLMIGSKFEHNDYTGFEYQPSVRLTWTPNEQHTIWAAASRAVRTPSRFEDDANLVLAVIPFATPTPLRMLGKRSTESEDLTAYEVGYRVKPTDRFSLDIAGFVNNYSDLIYTPPSRTNPLNVVFDNTTGGRTYGVEIVADWDVTDTWRLIGSYTLLRMQLHRDALEERNAPRNQFNVRSELDITKDLEFNSALYFVDNLPATDIPSYLRLDLGLTWRPKPNVEFSVWGQNLLDGAHPEFRDLFEAPDLQSQVERGLYAAIQVSF